MKQYIIKTLAVLLVLIGMVGIAAADPCPDPQTWGNQLPESSNIQVFHELVSGNTYNFMVQGIYAGAEFKELCIADNIAYANKWSAITTIPSWDGEIKEHQKNGVNTGRFFIQWKASHGYEVLPMDGTLHDIGTATFTDANWESSLTTLVHVVGSAFCDSKYPGENKDTCYVRPQPPSQLVPELSPLLLTSAGLLGIVLISRKFRGK